MYVRYLVLEGTGELTKEAPREPNLPCPLTRVDIMEKKKTDYFCKTELANMVPNHSSTLFEDIYVIVCHRDPVETACKKMVPPLSLRPIFLLLLNFIRLSGYPGQT